MILDSDRAFEIDGLRSPKMAGSPSAVNEKKILFLQSGLGLVELMVAMVIGIIGVLVMMQMFAVSEEQKRTTVSGSDSLTSGAIALATLQRDIQQSGWGISGRGSIGCSITGLLNGGSAVSLVPVRINPTGITKDANTDVIQIISGSGNGTVEGALINSIPSAGSYDVQASEAFSVGEMVFAAPEIRSATCSLSATSISSAAARPNVNVTATVAGMEGGRLFSLGVAPAISVYAVRGGTLSVCNYIADNCKDDPTKWQSIAENIVSMRAVYMPSGPSGLSPSQTPPSCGWAEIPAIRVVLVARSSQPEKNPDWPNHTQHVWGTAPTWAENGVAAITLPSPDATWPTWQDFRYKVFETVIPLRNVIAAGGVKEC